MHRPSAFSRFSLLPLPLFTPLLTSTVLHTFLPPGPEDVRATAGGAGGGAKGEEAYLPWPRTLWNVSALLDWLWLMQACGVVKVYYLPTNTCVKIL